MSLLRMENESGEVAKLRIHRKCFARMWILGERCYVRSRRGKKWIW